MKVMCIDSDFRTFVRTYGDRFIFPQEGEVYDVRSINKWGNYLLEGINNPMFCISKDPLMFEELHFRPQRFIPLETYSVTPPYMINQN